MFTYHITKLLIVFVHLNVCLMNTFIYLFLLLDRVYILIELINYIRNITSNYSMIYLK